MQHSMMSLSAACVLSVAVASAAAAAPVSSADLSGHSICWDNGSTSSYGRGGKYANTLSGEGTWAPTSGGFHIHTDRYDYVAAIQKMPDGSFQAEVLGAGIKTTGKYCH